jgi:manganese/iron transport system permease protein
MVFDPLLPFQFQFMNDAFLISFLVAVPMALLSCFVVLKGWSLMGDAISHAVFPGVVIAYILGIPFAIGAFVAGLGSAVATGYLAGNSRIKQDTVMGVVFSGMFAVGLVLFVAIQTDVHLDHILFGDMLGVSGQDMLIAAAVAVVTVAAVAIKWRDLLLHAFDAAQARVLGLPVNLLHYGLLCLISASIVAALAAVGIILAVAMLIAPGAIAFLLTRRFSVMMALALVTAIVASELGVYLSFFIDSAPAPTIVLLLAAAFVAAFIYSAIKTRVAASSAHATGKT